MVWSLTPSSSATCLIRRPASTSALTAPSGTTLELRLEPASGYRWTTVASSDHQVAEVTATTVDDTGAATATVALNTPGTTTLTATTSYQPDPHGPVTRLWRLTATVVL